MTIITAILLGALGAVGCWLMLPLVSAPRLSRPIHKAFADPADHLAEQLFETWTARR